MLHMRAITKMLSIAVAGKIIILGIGFGQRTNVTDNRISLHEFDIV
jgi:hypothetical protein